MKPLSLVFIGLITLAGAASAENEIVKSHMKVADVSLSADGNVVTASGTTNAPFIVTAEAATYVQQPDYWEITIVGTPNEKAGKCENDICPWKVSFRPEQFASFPLPVLKNIIENPGKEVARPRPQPVMGKVGIEVKGARRSVFLSWKNSPPFVKFDEREVR